MSTPFFMRRLNQKRIWGRILRERLSEPLHLNALALGVWAFGSFSAKVSFDLVLRQYHAFGLLRAAEAAREMRINTITAVEFGVASGAGLLNMCEIAREVTRATGVEFRIFGFDSGEGMPPSLDWRDHPNFYQYGDFPMGSPEVLRSKLPPHARLILGDLTDTVPTFLAGTDLVAAPIGFVSIDVDYYSSTVTALQLLDGDASWYLPATLLYLDDIEFIEHCRWAGEQLAAEEFNGAHEMRKIDRYAFLRNLRLFKNASWIDHMYVCHILDHPRRAGIGVRQVTRVLDNPYLPLKKAV